MISRPRLMRNPILLMLCVVLVKGACRHEPPSYPSADAMSAALETEGADCAAGSGAEAQLVKDSATCVMDGNETQLFVFADAEAKRKWLAFGRRLDEDLVEGPNWVAITSDPDLLENVRAALL